MKLALVALVFIGPTLRVVLVRLKANPDNSCIYIICFGQVQTSLNGVNRSKCVQIKKGFRQTDRHTHGFHYYIVVRCKNLNHIICDLTMHMAVRLGDNISLDLIS